MTSIHLFWASFLKTGLRPPQQASLSSRIGWRISAGQFASSQARVSLRKWSSSLIDASPLRKRQVPRSRGRGNPLRRGPPYRNASPVRDGAEAQGREVLEIVLVHPQGGLGPWLGRLAAARWT